MLSAEYESAIAIARQEVVLARSNLKLLQLSMRRALTAVDRVEAQLRRISQSPVGRAAPVASALPFSAEASTGAPDTLQVEGELVNSHVEGERVFVGIAAVGDHPDRVRCYRLALGCPYTSSLVGQRVRATIEAALVGEGSEVTSIDLADGREV